MLKPCVRNVSVPLCISIMCVYCDFVSQPNNDVVVCISPLSVSRFQTLSEMLKAYYGSSDKETVTVSDCLQCVLLILWLFLVAYIGRDGQTRHVSSS